MYQNVFEIHFIISFLVGKYLCLAGHEKCLLKKIVPVRCLFPHFLST